MNINDASIIAIPLAPKPETGLKPMPNFLVVESIFGNVKANSFNYFTGQFELTDCVTIAYKIVKRELLSNNEVIERILLPLENINIPVDILPMVFSYERISQNVSVLNVALSQFQFQGDLSGFNLQIDESKL